jgi:hypothetical protein
LKGGQQGGNLPTFARLSEWDNKGGKLMRTSIFAIVVAFGATIAPQAQAQEPSRKMQPDQQIQPGQQIQDDADKGIKTRNSGDSGLVADQEKPAAAAHPPGQPDQSTTGTSSGSGKSR